MKHNTFNIGDSVSFPVGLNTRCTGVITSKRKKDSDGKWGYDVKDGINTYFIFTSYVKAIQPPKPKFTPVQMAECFKHVENPKGWKLPINAAIPDPGEMNMNCLHDAIVFYTGAVPTFKKVGANVIVKSAGYNPANR